MKNHNILGRNIILSNNHKWNYAERYVDTSIPGYVEDDIQQFKHRKPKKP